MQLAAGCVDLATPGIAHRDRYSRLAEAGDETPDARRGRSAPSRARGRIERDEVDVASASHVPRRQASAACSGVSFTPSIITYSRLTRRPVLRGESPARVDDRCHRPLAVDRHELVTELIGRGVEADGEVHLRQLLDHAVDAGHDARGAHRDPTRTDAEALRVVEQSHRREHPVGVVQWLAHPHEHDVIRPAPPARPPVRAQGVPGRAMPVQHLVDDLPRRELAGEPRLPGGAERAVHGASGLRRDADGRALSHPSPRRVAHEDRFHPLPVVQLVNRLGREPGICGEDVARLDGAEPKRGGQGGAHGDREIGQRLEAADVAAMHAGQDLVDPVRGLAAGGEPRGERLRFDLADRRQRAGLCELSHDDRRRATRSRGTSAAR